MGGKQAGPRLRRCGAAHTMVRAAPVRATAARQSAQPLLLLIAMRASPIGSLAGASRRRRGAARTQERVAHSKVEVALEDDWGSAAYFQHAERGRGAVCRHLSRMDLFSRCNLPSGAECDALTALTSESRFSSSVDLESKL